MKYSRATYTKLIKNLQGLNREIRLRLSYMPLSTVPEMQNLGAWLEETKGMVRDLKDVSSIISQHFQILETAYQEKRKEDT